MSDTTEKTGTALTVLEASEYAIAKFSPVELHEAMRANLGDEQIGPNDFDRIRVPAAGGKLWMVPTLDGEGEAQKIIRGVIVASRTARAYWRESLDEGGGGTPPDCRSGDGKHGAGDPSGDCQECPFNEFESAAKGAGKACKEMRLLFLLTQDSLLPVVVVLPPTSLGAYKKFLMRLTSKATAYSAVEVEITLAEQQNKEGIKYSQAAFNVKQKLDPKSAENILAYAESMKAAFDQAGRTVTDKDV